MSDRGRTYGKMLGLSVLVLAVSLVALHEAELSSAQTASRASEAEVARGQYLVTIMDCGGCHTGGAMMGKPDPARLLAGSEVGFEVPGVGIVYPGNLTPDAETGLGRWSDAEIVRAFRQGQSRDGRVLIPIMPSPSYSVLNEADTKAVVAYLRSLPAVKFAAPKNSTAAERAPAPFMGLVQPK